LLVQYFLTKLCATSTGKADIAIDLELMRFLQTHAWLGNVRQLHDCLESMVVLARNNKLTIDELPAPIDEGLDARTEIEIPAGTTLQDLERTAVEQALEDQDGNRTHPAQSLGIAVRTLQRKLKTWGIDTTQAE
jgi:DNA-binding NtrC family response regulator